MPPSRADSSALAWLSAQSVLSFGKFQEAALFHPSFGFYSQQDRVFSSGGHFTTAPEVHHLVAQGLGNLIASYSRASGSVGALESLDLFPSYSHADSISLIEIGGGSGALMQGLLTHFLEANAFSRKLSVHMVERSKARREEQRKRLACFQDYSLQWHDCPADALMAEDSPAFIFSNELVDAFPAVQICWWQGEWQEVWLEFSSSGFVREHFRPLREGWDCDVPADPREGQRVFLHPSYHAWLQANYTSVTKPLVMVTIDYGRHYPSTECRGYFQQQRQEGFALYQNPGQQDLTCDVNFTDVQRWGEQLGWTTVYDDLLGAFLDQWVPVTDGEDAIAGRLRNPFDAGGAFRVLVQQGGA